MKFKIGDKVRVRMGLEVEGDYSDLLFAEGMKKFEGKIFTISDIDSYYHFDDDGRHWSWNDEMLEEVGSGKKKRYKKAKVRLL